MPSRAGEEPKIDAYVQQYPELADQIHELVATLGMVNILGQELPQPPEPNVQPESPTTGVLGDYRIMREIGRGGMGVVYEAEQISLGRHVALKVLPFAVVLDQRQIQRFKNEALAAAQLDHPNIVNVHGVGCERGVHFYAMRYIEGQTLAEVIQESRVKSPKARGAAGDGEKERRGDGEIRKLAVLMHFAHFLLCWLSADHLTGSAIKLRPATS